MGVNEHRDVHFNRLFVPSLYMEIMFGWEDPRQHPGARLGPPRSHSWAGEPG